MSNILRNITPAVAVMVAGLAGAYLVYDNFFTSRSSNEMAAIAPAAGDLNEESIIIADASAETTTDPTAGTTREMLTTSETSADAAVTTETTETHAEPAADCSALDAAATAAMGTTDAETAQKAAADCHAAAAAPTEGASTTEAPMGTAPAAATGASEGESAPEATESHEQH